MRFVSVIVLTVLMVGTFSIFCVGAAALTAPINPAHECDIIVIKSVESGRYLGVSQPSGSVSASYGYRDPRNRFDFTFLGGFSNPKALTVKVSAGGSNRRRRALAFEGSRGILKECAMSDCRDMAEPSNNASLGFGRWPASPIEIGGTNVGTVGGPFLRLYLVNGSGDPRAIVGVDESGHVALYPLDAAATNASVPTVNPSTLFFIDVISSPGWSACT